jgi:hypothetical protein
MARYFLLNGVLVPIYRGDGAISLAGSATAEETREYYILHGITPPKTYRLATIGNSALYVAYFFVDQGRLVIKAATRREGYIIATAVQAYLSLICDIERDHDSDSWWLFELGQLPHPEWSIQELLAAVTDDDVPQSPFDSTDLLRGVVLQAGQLELMPQYLSTLVGDRAIAEAYRHLSLSRALFAGTMNASYYHFHYRHDRRRTRRSTIEKRYLEGRERYELALVAAFKCIERLFGVNDVKRAELGKIFGSLPYRRIKQRGVYTRRFEIFSGHNKRTTVGDMLLHFLNLRNVVGAHGNRSPPKDFFISEDNIYEVQSFAEELIMMAMEDVRASGTYDCAVPVSSRAVRKSPSV